jgi:hypothetical protein
MQTTRGLYIPGALWGPQLYTPLRGRGPWTLISWGRRYLKEKKKPHNPRGWGGHYWKIPKIPLKSHDEVESHKEKYLVIV